MDVNIGSGQGRSFAIAQADESPGQRLAGHLVVLNRIPDSKRVVSKFNRGPFTPNDPSHRSITPTLRVRPRNETDEPEEHLWNPPPWVISDPDKRIVEGFASAPNLDDQGDIVPLSVIDAALPAYMQWANLREMHGKNAAGKILSATVKDGGVYVVGRVDDDSAWNKVKSGVYQGFSIGGDIIDVDHQNGARVITGMKLNEISLVDRPANQRARIQVVKFEKHYTGKTHTHASAHDKLVGSKEPHGDTHFEKPARSQAQRGFLYAVKGPKWAKKHHFNNKGPLPARIHPKTRHVWSQAQSKCEKHQLESCVECGCDRLVGHPMNTGHSSGMAEHPSRVVAVKFSGMEPRTGLTLAVSMRKVLPPAQRQNLLLIV